MANMCADAELQELMQSIQSDDRNEMVRTDRLLADFPGDARLHFLRGSILASIGRPIEALSSLKRAVDLAPDFAIARFQLGFFQLTSGEVGAALGTWGPLVLLPEGHYLRFFVGGLTHLIRNEFADAVTRLSEGITLNDENPALNHDMQLIIDQTHKLLRDADADAGAASVTETHEPASATSFLLDQLGSHGRPN